MDKGIAISAKRDQSSGYNRIDIEDTLSSEVSLRDTAQILLPELLLRRAAQLDPNSFNRIYSFVFESDRLFLTKKQLEKTLNSSSGQTTASLSEKITSRILSASIGKIKLKNLTENEEMRGRFRILSKDPGEVKCVYWKFNIEGMCCTDTSVFSFMFTDFISKLQSCNGFITVSNMKSHLSNSR